MRPGLAAATLGVLLSGTQARAQSEVLLAAEVGLIERIAGSPLTPAERDTVRAVGTAHHRADPAKDDRDAVDMLAMNDRAQHADAVGQAMFRERAMDGFTTVGVDPVFLPIGSVIRAHNPVLAEARDKPHTLTRRALDAYLATLDRTASLFGQPALSNAEREAIRTDAIRSFPTSDPIERLRLTSAESADLVLAAWIARANPAQLADATTLYDGHVDRRTLADAAGAMVDRAWSDRPAKP